MRPARLRTCRREPVSGGHPGAVVAAIFQPAQPLEQDRLRFPGADVADDAAHDGILADVGRPAGRCAATDSS